MLNYQELLVPLHQIRYLLSRDNYIFKTSVPNKFSVVSPSCICKLLICNYMCKWGGLEEHPPLKDS